MGAQTPPIQPRTLHEAARQLGGQRKLADLLDIEGWLVSRWLDGIGQPPEFVLLRCAELIESGKQAATVEGEREKNVAQAGCSST